MKVRSCFLLWSNAHLASWLRYSLVRRKSCKCTSAALSTCRQRFQRSSRLSESVKRSKPALKSWSTSLMSPRNTVARSTCTRWSTHSMPTSSPNVSKRLQQSWISKILAKNLKPLSTWILKCLNCLRNFLVSVLESQSPDLLQVWRLHESVSVLRRNETGTSILWWWVPLNGSRTIELFSRRTCPLVEDCELADTKVHSEWWLQHFARIRLSSIHPTMLLNYWLMLLIHFHIWEQLSLLLIII